MKNYFLQILIITVFSGIFSFLLSGKKCENLFRYLVSVCLLLALFAPMRGFFSEDFIFKLPEGAEGTADNEAYIEGVSKEASLRLTESYCAYIEKETGIGKEDYTLFVTVGCADKAFFVEKVTVKLHTLTGIAARDRINRCLKELKCEVIYIEKLL